MQHVLSMPEWGLVMQPDGHWHGSKEYEFKIDGISNSGDTTELNLQKTVWQSASVFK